MIETQGTLTIILAILALSLIIPELFKKLRMPFVTIVIMLGAVFGPYGLNYIQSNEIIAFLGFLGMSFVMLMAGLETNIKKMIKQKKKIAVMAALSGTIPFLTGLAMTKAFGYEWITSIMMGIIFMSASVAIITPALHHTKLHSKDFIQLVLSTVILLDIISLVALGIIFQSTNPITKLPLTSYYVILAISIALLFFVVPKLSEYVMKSFSRDEGHERLLRYVIVILVAALVYFSALGVHPVLASFLAGLALSQILQEKKAEIVYTKIHTLGYGIFIPVFFFIVGMNMDLSLFKNFDASNILMISIIFSLITSKLLGGYIAGRTIKLPRKESLIFGSIIMVQLTTTLAITYASSELNILDSALVTTIILVSLITTLIGPTMVSLISRYYKAQSKL